MEIFKNTNPGAGDEGGARGTGTIGGISAGVPQKTPSLRKD